MTILRVRHPGRIRSATAVTLMPRSRSCRRAGAFLACRKPVDVTTIEKIKAEETALARDGHRGLVERRVRSAAHLVAQRDSREGLGAQAAPVVGAVQRARRVVGHAGGGLGWENERFSLMATAPVPFIVEAVPQAWSGSTTAPVTGPAMMIQAGCIDELKEKYAGKLRGAFLMTVPSRDDHPR